MFGANVHLTSANKIIVGNNLLTGRYVFITGKAHDLFTEDELTKHLQSEYCHRRGKYSLVIMFRLEI